jgi:anion-transporting  ArsA/GET3 family ATPase
MTLAKLIKERSVIVCCGSGGVGKTTTSAAIALAAAQLGRHTCVVTIDPARRLADALGLGELTNTPHRIEGPWRGELDAVMLDARGTFDRLVSEHARDAEQAARIFENRLYRNLVSALSGTQEYMATEKLYELYDTGRYDLIVVDTPPSRHALDFLAAPQRLTAFLDNKLFRLLLAPGRASLRAVSVASQVLLKTIAKVAGKEIVEDTIAFFQAFDGMEQGFRDRAAAVDALLRGASTAFVLVTTPRRDAITEANYFTARLEETGRGVDLLISNRMHPDFGPPPADEAAAGAGEESAWSDLIENLGDLASITSREEEVVAALSGPAAAAALLRVPLLADDVHDLEGLAGLVRQLLGEALP